MNNITVIKIRRGLNGFKYSACSNDGHFIFNFEKLADVKKHWLWEIRHGLVKLVRELDKLPEDERRIKQ